MDKLWALHTEQLGADHRETEDPLGVWGRDGAPAGSVTSNVWKDRIRAQGVLSQGTRTASPYRRLKLVMDYWCALWFWPIRESERLPSRQDFLNEVSLVLTGSVYHPEVGTQVRSLFGDDYADAEHAANIAQRITDEVGMLDLEKLFEEFPRLRFVDELARQSPVPSLGAGVRRSVLRGRGGTGRRGAGSIWCWGTRRGSRWSGRSAGCWGSGTRRSRCGGCRRRSCRSSGQRRSSGIRGLRDAWIAEAEEAEAMQAFLNAGQNYPLAQAGQKDEPLQVLSSRWAGRLRNGRGIVGLPSSRTACTTIRRAGIASGRRYIRGSAAISSSRTRSASSRMCTTTSHLQRERVRAAAGRAPVSLIIANLYRTRRQWTPASATTAVGRSAGSRTRATADGASAGHRRPRSSKMDEEALRKPSSTLSGDTERAVNTQWLDFPARSRPTGYSAVLAKLVSHLPKRRSWQSGMRQVCLSSDWHETTFASGMEPFNVAESSFPRGAGGTLVSFPGPHFFLGNAAQAKHRVGGARLNSDYDVLDLTGTSGTTTYRARTTSPPATSLDYSERDATACLLGRAGRMMKPPQSLLPTFGW